MLTAHNFSYGLVTPVLAYLMSCLGAFLGLRCTARARAVTGRERLRWLLLAALSIGTTGIAPCDGGITRSGNPEAAETMALPRLASIGRSPP